MNTDRSLLAEHFVVTRRWLLKCAAGGAAIAPLLYANRRFLSNASADQEQVGALA